MLSLRRKYKHVKHEQGIEDLKAQFEARTCDGIECNGKNVMLKWLVRCAAAEAGSATPGAVVDEIDRINAVGTLPTPEAAEELHVRCSAWLAKVEVPAPYLEYLAYYFESVRVRRALRLPVCRLYDGTFTADDTWLSWSNVRRALVVPDVRKLALEIQWEMSLRPGEREFIKRLTNNTTSSVYGALQALRPAEYLAGMRTQMLYGTLEELYQRELLGAVVLAHIQTRMNNRSGMDWIQRCVRFAHSVQVPRGRSVPVLAVEQGKFVVAFGTGAIECKDVTTAFAYWCQHAPEIIDGRYDVSECTI